MDRRLQSAHFRWQRTSPGALEPLTLADLLKRAVDHIPHNAQYIEKKRKALNIGERALPLHMASVGVT